MNSNVKVCRCAVCRCAVINTSHLILVIQDNLKYTPSPVEFNSQVFLDPVNFEKKTSQIFLDKSKSSAKSFVTH